MGGVCGECGGSGHVLVGGVYRECRCALLRRARVYLGSEYVGGGWDDGMDVGKWGGDVLFEGSAKMFKRAVKSVLLGTGMRLRHLTVTPYDIMNRVYSDFGGVGGVHPYNELKGVEVLVVPMWSDPKNREYGSVLGGVFEHRELSGLRTWVGSTLPVDGVEWQGMYGEGLSRLLLSSRFRRLRRGVRA